MESTPAPRTWRDLAASLVLCALAAETLSSLGFRQAADLDWLIFMAVFAGLGSAAWWLRWMWFGWSLAGTALGLLLLIGGTPIMAATSPAFTLRQEPEKADVVIALSGDAGPKGRMGPISLQRVLSGAELVRAGWAEHLLTTDAAGIDFSADLATVDALLPDPRKRISVGPVASTRDEAVLAAALMKEKGWKKALLVTSPIHSARAAATFRKAGIDVVSVPSVERVMLLGDGYDSAAATGQDRISACNQWLREILATVQYRLRGWI